MFTVHKKARIKAEMEDPNADRTFRYKEQGRMARFLYSFWFPFKNLAGHSLKGCWAYLPDLILEQIFIYLPMEVCMRN